MPLTNPDARLWRLRAMFFRLDRAADLGASPARLRRIRRRIFRRCRALIRDYDFDGDYFRATIARRYFAEIERYSPRR